jgi:Helix-turn-helix domain
MKPDIEQILAEPTTSVPDAGAVLGLSRNAAYLAAQRGEIPTLKFGNRRRVPTARLRQMILDGVQPSRSAEGNG